MYLFKGFYHFQKIHPDTSLFKESVFIFPTETFYAIGCIATSDKAVQKIYTLKNRSKNSPLLVLVDSFSMLLAHTANLQVEKKILQAITKKAITVVLPANKKLSSFLNYPQKNSNQQFIGFRITQNKIAKKLIQLFKNPLVGTSANLSQQAPATKIIDIVPQMRENVSFLIDGGNTKGGLPSSLLDFSKFPQIKILREGFFALEKLEKIAKKYKLNLI